MNEKSSDILNTVYKEIADSMGMEAAKKIYSLFKGQQITFPIRFLNHQYLNSKIYEEYNGNNIRNLAIKYDYSEKTIRRIIKNKTKEENYGIAQQFVQQQKHD